MKFNLVVSMDGKDFDKFWDNVPSAFKEIGDCWEWEGRRIGRGYGGFSTRGLSFAAHQFSYFLAYGYFGSDHIHHECENKICVNPFHLERLDPVVHVRITSKYCRKRLHLMEGDNLFFTGGKRRCKACYKKRAKLYHKKYYEKNRVQILERMKQKNLECKQEILGVNNAKKKRF